MTTIFLGTFNIEENKVLTYSLILSTCQRRMIMEVVMKNFICEMTQQNLK